MQVLAVTRTPRQLDPSPDWLGGFDQLAHLLEHADFVLIACPLTEQTRGLIGQAQLARMKPDAVLINVARGPIADEDALFAALRDGVIGGAVLDTWYRYPSPAESDVRPSRHPFHELSNVVMTPHLSGWTEGLMPRRFAVIIDNLERLADGRPLLNQVHPGRMSVEMRIRPRGCSTAGTTTPPPGRPRSGRARSRAAGSRPMPRSLAPCSTGGRTRCSISAAARAGWCARWRSGACRRSASTARRR